MKTRKYLFERLFKEFVNEEPMPGSGTANFYISLRAAKAKDKQGAWGTGTINGFPEILKQTTRSKRGNTMVTFRVGGTPKGMVDMRWLQDKPNDFAVFDLSGKRIMAPIEARPGLFVDNPLVVYSADLTKYLQNLYPKHDPGARFGSIDNPEDDSMVPPAT
jgi:hypothetical protein